MKKYLMVLVGIFALVLLVSGGKYLYGQYQAEKSAEEDIVTVACIGDSLTFRRRYDDSEIYNYPSILGELLGEKYKVTNYGMAGTCVQADLSHAYVNTRAYRVSVEAEADILVIMLGSNDIWNDCWRDEATFYKHYTAFIDSYLQGNPEIYLCTIPYIFIGEDPSSSIYNEIGEKITTVIYQIAEERDYSIVDIRQISMEHQEWYEEDGLHFNLNGANDVAEVVYKAINRSTEDER